MTSSRNYRLLLNGLLVSLLFLMAIPAVAGPITNPGAQPFSKFTVYGGIVSIVNGTNALELGANGQDIASNGDIIFRPRDVFGQQAVNIKKNDSSGGSDMYVVGTVCLHGSGSADCRNQWPSGSLWQQFSPNYTAFAVTPNVNNGVTIGTSAAAPTVTTQPGLLVSQPGSSYAARILNANLSGSAIRVDGNVLFRAGFSASGTAYIGGQEVWYSGHEGVGSGLDADLMDGRQVTQQTAAQCSGTDHGTHFMCLCFDYSGTKKCAAMYNYF